MSRMITIRCARPSDALHITRLVLFSAPTFLPAVFGPGIDKAIEEMAAGQGTLFSYEHAVIAEQDGAVRGMLLAYSGVVKAAQDPRTGLALLGALRTGMIRRLPRLLKLQSAIGRIGKDEYYISNVAVYPEQRGRGIGSLLIARASDEARKAAIRLVLDVETDNPAAQRLYERIGFRVVSETRPFVIEDHAFAFRRMALVRQTRPKARFC
jgi:ribosomal protein S18 acetylase RimI-like enzyme